MDVILAGHNIDYDIIREIAAERPERQDLTPETVAAAYARISRYPRPVNELRRIARGEVEKARASNRNIVFEMGHSSIAEHAVFNLDVLGVSRLLVEEIEKFRLASYTEKSQRYVLLQDDFVIPAEIRQAGLEEDFVAAVRMQNRFYHEFYEKLRPHVFARNPELAADPANKSLLEGWAKEDARYVLALATETQLGMTVNARNIELMIRRLAACPLAEANEYSRRLYDATRDVAPSLVRYTEPTAYDRETREALRAQAAEIVATMAPELSGSQGETGKCPERPAGSAGEKDGLVRLIEATSGADETVVAALLHSSSPLPLARCREIAAGIDGAGKEALVKTSLRRMKAYDAAPREFEHVGLTFELTISATCFAQVKRHRMATITVQDYDPALGVTVPPAVAAVGMERPFREVCARSEEMWEMIRRVSPAAAAYVLTNAHRRRVAMRLSARELYHMARVRADGHAQWDIRETALQMVNEGRKVMPLTLMLASGKDGFDSLYERTFAGKD
ncbi:MAG: FAD-dependent thymidylate synthase [Proteobacteria bacterium]|nr:FAD-dependent thymidylate synthase [Pseudomonadota bacterium]MBU2228633.1 FAD-dependent thymidylate synthase [Pseudomonadota bacterium]MBU2262935.1 FAD-dependent thymidylate synthase [Pseudomonadota bacterium]